MVIRLLQATDFRKQGALFPLDTSGIARSLRLSGSRLSHGVGSLRNLMTGMFEHRGKIGLKALESTDTALALKRAIGGIARRTNANSATGSNACAIARHVHDARNGGGAKSLVKGIDNIDAAEDGRHSTSKTIANTQALNQPETSSAGSRVCTRSIARKQQSLTRSALLLDSKGTQTGKCLLISSDQSIDIGRKQAFH